MNSAAYVDALIAEMKGKDIPLSDKAWAVAMGCVEWAYVFGAYGEYCDPSNRRSRYNGTKDEKAKAPIKAKCKNFNGKDTIPSGCVGCKWFLGDASSDESKHEGRTRFFDCRGFVYYVLDKLFGAFGGKCPAGCTTMWNTESYWKEKGLVKDGVPDNVLVCLFKQDKEKPSVMDHIGFAYHGETVECSSGVEYHESLNKKWTHYAIPACIADDTPTPTGKPTLRKGDAGPYVTLAQTELIQRGYDLGSWGADGKFGNATEKAVKQFQQDWGLTVDGVIGQKTWAMLDSTPVKITYTVTVPHLSLGDAEALAKLYDGAVITKEGEA